MQTMDGRSTRPRGISRLFDFGRKHGLLVAFLFVLFLGTWAFEAARTDGAQGLAFFDSLYQSLQMFVMGFSMPPGATGNAWLSGLLTVLSYAAVVISSSAVIGVFAQRLGAPLRLRWQAMRHQGLPGKLCPPAIGRNAGWRKPRKRAVLLGFGKINRAVAQNLKAQNYSISAIDERFDEPAQLIARNNGVLLVAGDLSDTSSLKRGLLDAADIVIVSAGNDVINIEIASAAHALVPAANIYAHVASPGFADDLRESIDTGFPLADGIRTFSVKQESARNLLRRAHLAREARERMQDRVHLVIVGMGDQGEAIMLEALQSAVSIDLGPPVITVIDKDAAAIEKRFRARRPDLFVPEDEKASVEAGEETQPRLPEEAQPRITFLSLEVETVDFMAEHLDSQLGSTPVTAYVFCCGEDATNLAAGLRLEHAMSLGRRSPAPVFLTVWGAGVDVELYDSRDPLGYCSLFGAVEPAMAGAAFLMGDPDYLARLLHEAYEKQREEFRPGSPPNPWSGLPQTMKEANRRAVRHAHVKLVDLDLHWRGMGRAKLPSIASTVAGSLATVPVDIDSPGILDGRVAAPLPHRLIAELAETEHRRWLLDRAMDGWRLAEDGIRNNTARLHPNMVSFRKLEPRDQHYDTVLVRALIREFAPPEPNSVIAYGAKRSCLFILPDGVADGSIAPGTTELILVFHAQDYRFPASVPTALVRQINAWAATTQACRVRLVLGQRFATDVPNSLAASAAVYLRPLVSSIPADIDLSVIRLYGAGAGAKVPMETMDEYLARALADRHLPQAELDAAASG